jgi:hypothetical protein
LTARSYIYTAAFKLLPKPARTVLSPAAAERRDVEEKDATKKGREKTKAWKRKTIDEKVTLCPETVENVCLKYFFNFFQKTVDKFIVL